MKNHLKRWFEIKKTKQVFFSLCNIVSPLIIGAIVYFLFVPTAHISVMFYDLLKKSFFINNIDLTGSIITCYLADFLWAYAMFFIVLIIYVQKISDFSKAIAICMMFETVVEILQLTPIIDGTFDWLDIVVEIIANLIGFGVLLIRCTILNKRGYCHDCNKFGILNHTNFFSET